ncbi:FeoA family protein [Comamonas granuli]|uniref:FeoA family protein n=1 Tax=Comamonas granuli TaxID=290309 RepID=UPI0005A86F58|nr:FeoA family protein [Comamonas granuli]
MDAALPLTAPAPTAAGEPGLVHWPLRTDAWVQGLDMEAAAEDADLLLRLLEIGFLPGERVQVLARAFPAGDPIAVRVGRSTFALRRREAALVRIVARPPAPMGAA